jgi:phosphoglycolate phosphatase-like HAD superfamily hydrolase
LKLIIECDGPVLDPKPAYWAAYSHAVATIGLARADRDAVWRAIRTSAPIGQILKGAKTRQVHEYGAIFQQALESDDSIAQLTPQPDVGRSIRQLATCGECILVTAGSNRKARQSVLDDHDLSIHFFQMAGLPEQPFAKVERLQKLVDQEQRVVLAASTPAVVRAGVSANLIVVGIDSGACTARGLTQAGAQMTMGSLEQLAEDLTSGGHELVACGLAPPKPEVVSPFPSTDRSRNERRYSRSSRRR